MEMSKAVVEFCELVERLPEDERRRTAARALELIAEEMSLRDLRRAIGKTQSTVARRLKIGQEAVSKLESRNDMYISTLRDVLKAMGGELELIAKFPDRPAVRLQRLGAATPSRKRHSAA
jgi:hypothetical protein